MGDSNQKQPVKKEHKAIVNSVPIRVKKSTARVIKSFVAKANKKDLGRKIKSDDLLEKALSLLQDSHIEELKEASLSNSDRLELQYREYAKQNGPVKKDAFLGLLLTGKVNKSSFENQQHLEKLSNTQGSF